MKWVKIVLALVAVGALVTVAFLSNTSSNGVANTPPQVGQYQAAPQQVPSQTDDAERSAIGNLKLR